MDCSAIEEEEEEEEERKKERKKDKEEEEDDDDDDEDEGRRSLKLTCHLQLIPRLRISGAVRISVLHVCLLGLH